MIRGVIRGARRGVIRGARRGARRGVINSIHCPFAAMAEYQFYDRNAVMLDTAPGSPRGN